MHALSWYAAPSPSCALRSFPRCSWAQLLLLLQIILSSNFACRKSMHSAVTWPHLTGTNIDVVWPNCSLISRQYSWGLVPFELTDKQEGGSVHPQSPSTSSLPRHEPSCTQLLCGDLKAPSIDISAFSTNHYHPTIRLFRIILQKSSKKCKQPILISSCTNQNLKSLSQRLSLPPLCGFLDLLEKSFSQPRW